jgi:glucosamine--fructose-6-phosphate aminotransferase (isomerizing)
VPESSIAREADIVLPTFAGPEIGVASTKAFTCQLERAGRARHRGRRARGTLSAERKTKLCAALLETPRHIVEFLKQEPKRSKRWVWKSPRRATCSISGAA